MTGISLYQYQTLNNQLKALPKSEQIAYCRENGFRSWLSNADSAANYGKYAHLARKH